MQGMIGIIMFVKLQSRALTS